MAGDLKSTGSTLERKQVSWIVLMFVLLLVLNATILAAAYVVAFRPFSLDTRDNSEGQVGPVYKLDEFVVNVGTINARKICQVVVALELADNKVTKDVQTREAEIRNAVITVLQLNTLECLKENGDTSKLRDIITSEINEILGDGKVRQTWFTEFFLE